MQQVFSRNNSNKNNNSILRPRTQQSSPSQVGQIFANRSLLPSVGSQKGSTQSRLPRLSPSEDKIEAPAGDPMIEAAVCTVQGRRPYQEDQYAICRNLKDPFSPPDAIPETHFFGVFDGHAGGKCSKAISSTIPQQLTRDEAFGTKLTLAIKRAIQKTNDQFLEIAGRMRLNDGSTGVCVLLRMRTLIVANVGDSRAILISNRRVIPLTEDHKPSNPSEQKRIASFGGNITYNTGIARVAGVLAVSRAFGNFGIRNLIRADPDIIQRDLTNEDHFIVIASDGLWDVFRNNEVSDICYNLERHGVQKIADHLVQMSLSRGSMDNVTCIVVHLTKYFSRIVAMEGDGGRPRYNSDEMMSMAVGNVNRSSSNSPIPSPIKAEMQSSNYNALNNPNKQAGRGKNKLSYDTTDDDNFDDQNTISSGLYQGSIADSHAPPINSGKLRYKSTDSDDKNQDDRSRVIRPRTTQQQYGQYESSSLMEINKSNSGYAQEKDNGYYERPNTTSLQSRTINTTHPPINDPLHSPIGVLGGNVKRPGSANEPGPSLLKLSTTGYAANKSGRYNNTGGSNAPMLAFGNSHSGEAIASDPDFIVEDGSISRPYSPIVTEPKRIIQDKRSNVVSGPSTLSRDSSPLERIRNQFGSTSSSLLRKSYSQG